MTLGAQLCLTHPRCLNYLETKDRFLQLPLQTLYQTKMYLLATVILKSMIRENMRKIEIIKIKNSRQTFQNGLFIVVCFYCK